MMAGESQGSKTQGNVPTWHHFSFFCLLWICWGFPFASTAAVTKKNSDEISKNITNILNQLTHPGAYDKRLRPDYGGTPVDVVISIYVSSISAVSEVTMDYTLDFYLRQSWTDPRLAFKGALKDITIGIDYMKNIWVPDTFFPNEKKSFFHTATTHNSFLRITETGGVFTSQRLTVTATCPMNLQLFPLDSQYCTLEVESYGYSTTNIQYNWLNQTNKNPVGISEDVKLPQFKIKNSRWKDKKEVLATGTYSRLECQFTFERQLGFYLIQIYLPSQLIVIISWVSFWLSRDATPARVALGITTVLTMTTLMTTTNAALPKVSYIKSIDIYLITCYSMVFAALLEYAAVCYLNKVIKRRKEKRVQNTRPAPAEVETSLNSQQISKPPTVVQRVGVGSPAASTMGLISTGPDSTPHFMHVHDDSPKICTCDWEKKTTMSKLKSTAKKKPKPQQLIAVTPSAVDKYSRVVFPVCFSVFNAFYWGIYMHISQKAAEEAINTYMD